MSRAGGRRGDASGWMAAPLRSVTPDANACRTFPPPKQHARASLLIAAAGTLTNGRPTLARAEVVFVLPIETYDPTSERTHPPMLYAVFRPLQTKWLLSVALI